MIDVYLEWRMAYWNQVTTNPSSPSAEDPTFITDPPLLQYIAVYVYDPTEEIGDPIWISTNDTAIQNVETMQAYQVQIPSSVYDGSSGEQVRIAIEVVSLNDFMQVAVDDFRIVPIREGMPRSGHEIIPGTPVEPYGDDWLTLPDYFVAEASVKSAPLLVETSGLVGPTSTESGTGGENLSLLTVLETNSAETSLLLDILEAQSQETSGGETTGGTTTTETSGSDESSSTPTTETTGSEETGTGGEETNTGSDEPGTDTSSEDQSTEPSTEEEPATEGEETTTSEDGQTAPSDGDTPTSDEDQPQQVAAWEGDLTTTLVFDMDDANALRVLSMNGDSTVTARNATDLDHIAGKMAAGETITFSPDLIRLTDLFA